MMTLDFRRINIENVVHVHDIASISIPKAFQPWLLTVDTLHTKTSHTAVSIFLIDTSQISLKRSILTQFFRVLSSIERYFFAFLELVPSKFQSK